MTSTLSDGQLSTKETMRFNFGEIHHIDEIPHCKMVGQIEQETGDLYVHIYLDKDNWSRELYYSMLDRWIDIKKVLKEEYGLSYVKTTITAHNNMNKKFLNLFGFVTDSPVLFLDNGQALEIMKAEF